jgi:hypothetical protein
MEIGRVGEVHSKKGETSYKHYDLCIIQKISSLPSDAVLQRAYFFRGLS